MACKRTIVIMVILVSMSVTTASGEGFDMVECILECGFEDCVQLRGATLRACSRPCHNLCKEVKKTGSRDIYNCTFNCVNYQCLPYIPFATWYQCFSACHSACKEDDNGGDSAQFQASLFKNYKHAVPPSSPKAL